MDMSQDRKKTPDEISSYLLHTTFVSEERSGRRFKDASTHFHTLLVTQGEPSLIIGRNFKQIPLHLKEMVCARPS